MKIFVITLSVIFLVLLSAMGAAEGFFHKAMETKDIEFLKTAQRLDPFSSEYFYGEYELTHDISALAQAIRLEPTKPAYHMYYGLALLEMPQRTRPTDQEAVIEICKGSQLKPYSHLYRSVCESYKAVIPVTASTL